jgi:CAAX prenyl protease-like protein
MPQSQQKAAESAPASKRPFIRDDVAYILPMLVFLACVQGGATWKNLYPHFYVARAFIVPVLLAICWRSFTRIRWNHLWLGAVLGVVGLVQWIGMQLLIQKLYIGGKYPFAPDPDAFNPLKSFSSPGIAWTWIVIRIASAALVVPVMEELFWRDFLWRTIIAPADFKLAKVGEKNWLAFFVVCAAFATVHGNWWPTAIVWGMMVGALLLYTKSIGACIVMHGVTNFLLAMYVLWTHDWSFW